MPPDPQLIRDTFTLTDGHLYRRRSNKLVKPARTVKVGSTGVSYDKVIRILEGKADTEAQCDSRSSTPGQLLLYRKSWYLLEQQLARRCRRGHDYQLVDGVVMLMHAFYRRSKNKGTPYTQALYADTGLINQCNVINQLEDFATFTVESLRLIAATKPFVINKRAARETARDISSTFTGYMDSIIGHDHYGLRLTAYMAFANRVFALAKRSRGNDGFRGSVRQGKASVLQQDVNLLADAAVSTITRIKDTPMVPVQVGKRKDATERASGAVLRHIHNSVYKAIRHLPMADRIDFMAELGKLAYSLTGQYKTGDKRYGRNHLYMYLHRQGLAMEFLNTVKRRARRFKPGQDLPKRNAMHLWAFCEEHVPETLRHFSVDIMIAVRHHLEKPISQATYGELDDALEAVEEEIEGWKTFMKLRRGMGE